MTMANGDSVSGEQGQDTLAGDSASSKESELEARLTQANQKQAEASLYAKLMQDPDFAAMSRAKASGKKVRVVQEDDQVVSLADQLVPRIEAQPDLDKMTNAELMQHFMHENVKLVEKVVNQKVAPFQEQLQGVQQVTANQAKREAEAVINQTRAKYPDFDKHVHRISELNQQYPALNPNQLYALAKTELGEPIIEARQLASERPGSTTTRPPTHQTRKTPLPPGMLGLRQAIQESAKRRLSDGTIPGGDMDED